MRNVLAKVAKTQQDAVTAMVKTIFVQPTAGAVSTQVRAVADDHARQWGVRRPLRGLHLSRDRASDYLPAMPL